MVRKLRKVKKHGNDDMKKSSLLELVHMFSVWLWFGIVLYEVRVEEAGEFQIGKRW